MKASKLIVGCIATFLATAVIAAESTNATAKVKLTPEQRRARREARIAADGGMLARPAKGKVVRVLLRTKHFSMADAIAEAANMTRIMHVFVEVVESEEQSKNKTGCLITLADMDKAPTLLVAPEDYWATVNVSNLAADKPAPDVLKSRVVKEMWRAIGYALGAANSSQYTCVMRPISCPADLDREKVAVLTPQPMMAVANTANKLGFAKGGQTTYRKACQEGWAPQPTNDVQKAIWEEVHAIPDKPLQIKKQK